VCTGALQTQVESNARAGLAEKDKSKKVITVRADV
jgi:hypothetical protein